MTAEVRAKTRSPDVFGAGVDDVSGDRGDACLAGSEGAALAVAATGAKFNQLLADLGDILIGDVERATVR